MRIAAQCTPKEPSAVGIPLQTPTVQKQFVLLKMANQAKTYSVYIHVQ